MDEQLKTNLTSSEHWTRFIYMLLFSLFLYIASLLAAVIVVAQFIFALVTGGPNTRLREFGGEVVTYINQVWMFLTYNNEEKAYPFADWPTVTTSAVESEPLAAEDTADTKAAKVKSDIEAAAPASDDAPVVEGVVDSVDSVDDTVEQATTNLEPATEVEPEPNAESQTDTEDAEGDRKPEKLEQ